MADTEKQLPPSAKRLRDARERGQVASSRDLSAALGGLAATAALVSTGSVMLTKLSGHIATTLGHLGDARLREFRPDDLMPMVSTGLLLIAAIVGPVAAAAAGAGVFGGLLQTRFNYTTKALGIKWDRLSPANNLKKFTPSRAGLDTLKTIVVATVLGVLVWKIAFALVVDVNHLAWEQTVLSARRGWDDALRLLWQSGLALVAFGAGDYALQKWRLTESLKMSHQEYREEAKQESNPEIKGRIKRIQREMYRRRMMKAVPTATVVITNPTHFAVALEYNRAKNPAPVVVAKGADLVAAKIREIARHHSVPIIENPPLARALFKECELGDTIPGPLFGAVAEVLAYLIRIKQLVI